MDSTGVSQATPAPVSSPAPPGGIVSGDVCDRVQRKEAFFLIDGGMRPVYALPRETRDQYIPPAVREQLQHPLRGWVTRCFRLETPLMATRPYWQSISKAAKSAPAYFEELHIVGTDTGPECHAWTFQAPEGTRRPARGTPCIQLPPAGDARDKELAIYNADEEKDCKITTADDRVLGQLKPEEAALYQQHWSDDHGYEWQMKVSYKPEDVDVHSNPLMVEGQPVCLYKKDSSDQLLPASPREGELFIPAKMVCDVIARKRPDHPPPVVCSNQTNVRNFLQASPDEPALSFIFHDTWTEHLIAVRIVRDPDNNRVVCYLNETLGNKLDTSKAIRKTIIEGLKESCPGQKIVVIHPDEVIQRDFAACGAFTIKGVRYFDKHPEFDREILRMAGDSISPGKGKKLDPKDRVEERPITLKQMPAHLLKLYQGSLDPEQLQKLITTEQLDAPVSSKGTEKESLREYIARHQKELPKLYEPETTGYVNMAAFRKRYKYMSQGLSLSHARQCFSPERQATRTEAEIKDVPVLPRKRITSALTEPDSPKRPKVKRVSSSSEFSEPEESIPASDDEGSVFTPETRKPGPSKTPVRKKARTSQSLKGKEKLSAKQIRNLRERERKQKVIDAMKGLRSTLNDAGYNAPTEVSTLVAANTYIQKLQKDKARLKKKVKTLKSKKPRGSEL